MSKISDYGWKLVNRQLNGAALFGKAWTVEGRCQSFARQVADRALGFSVYGKYGNGRAKGEVCPTGTWPVWKAYQGGILVASSMQPGDLLIQPYGSNGYGHIGIYLGKRPGDSSGKQYVLENTWTNRGIVISGPIRLTELSVFRDKGYHIIRFPEDTKSATDASGAAPAATPGGDPVPDSTPAPESGGKSLTAIAAQFFNSELVKPVPYHEPEPDETLFVYNAIGEANQIRAPGVDLTNLHGVNSMVLLRKPAADEMEQAMPFLGPLSVSLKDSWAVFKQRWDNLKARLGHFESWGRYYEPIYKLADPSPDAANYRWGLPGITSINLRQTSEGSSVAEIEMQIDDHEAAEMVLSTLNMTQRYKNLLVEIWLPTVYYDDYADKDKQRLVLEPAFVGMLQEVTASPWPHNIRFRVVPQDAMMNLVALGNHPDFSGHFEGKKSAADIIGAIGNAYNMLFYAPNPPSLGELADAFDGVGQLGLSGIPELQAELDNFDTFMQPPLDVVRQLVDQRGLKMQRLMGFELFGKRIFGTLPRSIWLIYNPKEWNPFTKEYWENASWKAFFKPIADLISPGHESMGNLAVFYPHNMAHNPKRIKMIAGVLDTFATDDARRNHYWTLIQNLEGIAGMLGIGDGGDVEAVYESATQSKLVEFLDGLYGHAGTLSRVTKAMCPVLEVENMTTRTPSEPELANPLFGTDNGLGTQHNPVTAEKAAKLMNVTQQPDGTFHLFTQSGEQSFDRKDQVYLKYIPNMSRPYTVDPAKTPVADAGRFYPYTLTLRVKPTHGVRTGMMAALVGFGRIDGIWEVYEVNRELDAHNASMTVVLRCMRDLYMV